MATDFYTAFVEMAERHADFEQRDSLYIRREVKTPTNTGSNRITRTRVGATEAKQRISGSGTISSGTFTLALGGPSSIPIPIVATKFQVWDAVKGLAAVGDGNVRCEGGPLPGTPIDVIFTGDLSGTNPALLTVNNSSVLGGGSFGISSITSGIAATSYPCDLEPLGFQTPQERQAASKITSLTPQLITVPHDLLILETDELEIGSHTYAVRGIVKQGVLAITQGIVADQVK